MSTFIAVQTHKMPPADYHACPNWSVSQTKLLPDSPEEFYGLHVAEPPRWVKEPTPAMKFGSMIHARLLEPDTFAQLYPQAEQCSGVLKSGKGAGERCSHQGSFRLPDGTWLCGVHTKGESSARLVNCITSEDAAHQFDREKLRGVRRRQIASRGQGRNRVFAFRHAPADGASGSRPSRQVVHPRRGSCDPGRQNGFLRPVQRTPHGRAVYGLGYHRQRPGIST